MRLWMPVMRPPFMDCTHDSCNCLAAVGVMKILNAVSYCPAELVTSVLCVFLAKAQDLIQDLN